MSKLDILWICLCIICCIPILTIVLDAVLTDAGMLVRSIRMGWKELVKAFKEDI